MRWTPMRWPTSVSSTITRAIMGPQKTTIGGVGDAISGHEQLAYERCHVAQQPWSLPLECREIEGIAGETSAGTGDAAAALARGPPAHWDVPAESCQHGVRAWGFLQCGNELLTSSGVMSTKGWR